MRRNISIVSQEIFLFRGTIADNIRYARPDATKEEVIAAAKAANAHDFILRLPEGYETVVGTAVVRCQAENSRESRSARALLLAAVDTDTRRGGPRLWTPRPNA